MRAVKSVTFYKAAILIRLSVLAILNDTEVNYFLPLKSSKSNWILWQWVVPAWMFQSMWHPRGAWGWWWSLEAANIHQDLQETTVSHTRLYLPESVNKYRELCNMASIIIFPSCFTKGLALRWILVSLTHCSLNILFFQEGAGEESKDRGGENIKNNYIVQMYFYFSTYSIYLTIGIMTIYKYICTKWWNVYWYLLFHIASYNIVSACDINILIYF